MASNSRLVITTGAFFITTIGYFVALIVNDLLSNWEFLQNLDLISPLQLAYLLIAITMFVLTIILYAFSSKFAEYDENIGLGLFFVILWIICSLGLVIGSIVFDIVMNSGSVTINLDLIITYFFQLLTFGLIPALATILSIRNK